MLCDDCADCIDGRCLSPNDEARKRHDAAERDQWDLEDCEDMRERSVRPSEDEDTDDRLADLFGRLAESDLWRDIDGEDPEVRIQRRADDAARAFKGGRRHLPEHAIDSRRPLSTDLRRRLLRLLVDCPELEKARGRKYRFTWRTTEWRSAGSPVWGSSKPIPQPQREKFGIPESWEVILSLPVWLCLDDDARSRLLHHELMHAARHQRGHDVEEWPETVARYGLGIKPHALLALSGIAHKSTLARVETWGLLPGGQVTFLPTKGLDTIEVRVPA